ncbi:MAG: autotransporter-associated beta strand repeat-containing protein, partial [Rhizomicrobium sp.]
MSSSVLTINAGSTLQLGDGASDGFINNNITNNGLIRYNYPDTYDVSYVISGTGDVEIASGAISIRNSQAYTGQTIIDAGAQFYLGSGTNTVSLASSAIIDNGTFYINDSNTLTLGQTISGTGSLVLLYDNSDLTLTGENTFTGGVALRGMSTLRIGNGGTTGSLTSDITGSGTGYGTVIFNRADAYTYSGAITNVYTIEVATGTVTLTGTNSSTYTNIDIGATLQIGNGGTSGSLTSQITDDGTLIINRSDDYELDKTILGSGVLDISGTGTVSLGGNTAGFAGTTIIDSGATLALTYSSGNILSNNITDNGTLLINNTTRNIIAGEIVGSGSLHLSLTSKLYITGDASHTGGTLIDEDARLYIGNSGTTGSVAGNIVNNGILDFNRTDAYSYTSDISGSGSVYIESGGTLTLGGNNSYTGTTSILESSTLILGSDTALPQGASVGIMTNATLDLNGHNASVATLVAQGHLALTNATLTLTGDSYFLGTTTGTGGITISNGAAVYFGYSGYTSTSTYSGATIIEDGTLFANTSGSLSANSVFTVARGSSLQLASGASNAIGSLYGAGSVTVTNSTLTVANGGIFSGVISGTGLLDAAGGTLILTGANTYTGDTVIDSGATLQIGNGGTTGSIIGNITDNGTLIFKRTDGLLYSSVISGSGGVTVESGDVYLTGTNTYTGTTTINAGAYLIIGNGSTSATTGSIISDVVNNGTLEFNRSDRLTYAGNISGSGDVSVSAGGSVILAGSNSYSGNTYITNGTLIAGSANAISSSSIISISSTGSLNLNNYNASTPAVFGFGTISLGSGTLTITDSGSKDYAIYQYGGVISGTGGVTLSAGTLYLTGENTYTGDTTIASGATLYIGAGGTTGSVAGNIADNGALLFDRSDDITYSGNISGSGTVSKWGDGVLTLSGSNSYSGNTNIATGTLRLGSETALSAATVVTVYEIATLDLNGYNSTISSLIGTGSVTLGSATLTIANGGSYSGIISGTGSMTISGGVMGLYGTNTYTGGTTIASGATLQIGNGSTTGSIVGNIV